MAMMRESSQKKVLNLAFTRSSCLVTVLCLLSYCFVQASTQNLSAIQDVACNGSAWSCRGKCNSTDYFPCSCRPSCKKYAICCEDFDDVCRFNKPTASEQNTDLEKDQDVASRFYCSELVGIWLVASCSGLSEEGKNNSCVHPNEDSIHDMIPVSDPTTKTHYRNIFCALCNGANTTIPWTKPDDCVNFNNCKSEMKNPLNGYSLACMQFEDPLMNRSLQRFSVEQFLELNRKCNAFTSYVIDNDTSKVYRNRYCLLLDDNATTNCSAPQLDLEEKHCLHLNRGLPENIDSCMAEICALENSLTDTYCPNETLDLYFNINFSVGVGGIHDQNAEEKLKLSSESSTNNLIQLFVSNGDYLTCVLHRLFYLPEVDATVKSFAHLNCTVTKVHNNGSLSVDDILDMISNSIYSANDVFKIPLAVELVVCMKRTTKYRKPSTLCSGAKFKVDLVTKTNESPSSISIEGYISIICCILSDLGLLLRISLQRRVPYFQTLPGKIQFALCLTLLFAYSFFLVGGLVKVGSAACYSIAVFTHWSFLSSLFWMNVIAFQIWRTFRVWHNQVVVRSTRVLILSSVYAMGIPTAIVMTSLGMEFLYPENSFSPAYGKSSCWMNKSYSVLTWFVIPCCTLSLVNGIFAFLTVCSLRVQRNRQMSESSGKNTPVNDFAVSARIIILVGVTWLLGLLAAFQESPITWMIFSAVNASLGFFISLVLLCNKRVFRLLKDRCFCPTKENVSTITLNTLPPT